MLTNVLHRLAANAWVYDKIQVLTGERDSNRRLSVQIAPVREQSLVLDLAGGLDNEIMAFRFDDTELLRPMGWDEHQAILRERDVRTNFESPIGIEPEVFGAIYTASFGPPPVR